MLMKMVSTKKCPRSQDSSKNATATFVKNLLIFETAGEAFKINFKYLNCVKVSE